MELSPKPPAVKGPAETFTGDVWVDPITRGLPPTQLQAYLFDVVSDEPRRQDDLAVLDRFGQAAYGTRLSPADMDGALRTARAERDTELGIHEAGG